MVRLAPVLLSYLIVLQTTPMLLLLLSVGLSVGIADAAAAAAPAASPHCGLCR